MGCVAMKGCLGSLEIGHPSGGVGGWVVGGREKEKKNHKKQIAFTAEQIS